MPVTLADALDHHRAGRFDAAEAAYRALLSAAPDHPDLLRLLGLLRFQQGAPDDSVQLLERAVTRHPDFLEGHRSLAAVLDRLGRRDAALDHHAEAARLAPGDPGVHNDFGCALLAAGRPAEAADILRIAIGLAADLAAGQNAQAEDALVNLGAALNSLGQTTEALAAATYATALRPDHAGALRNLSIVLASAGRYSEAERAARRAVRLDPGDAGAWVQLGNMLIDLGEPDEAAETYAQALDRDPDHRTAAGNRLYALHLSPTISDEALAEAVRAWGDRHPTAGPRPDTGCDPDRVLRIGYVSADFARHPVGWFLAPVLPNHDPSHVEIHCYSGRVVEDGLTRHLRRHAHSWVPTAGLDDDTLAARIRADGIDLLIDLGGHTAHSRLTMFAQAPAPVQATWGGLIGTTGLRQSMDWLIADPRQIPPDLDHFYTEQIARLPHGYVCYGPPDYAPPVEPVPALATGHVTFGCFNRLAKIGDGTVALWARVLDAVPGSRLLLNTREFSCPDLRARTLDRFSRSGIGGDRLELRPGGSHADMLAAYASVDIALDPMPYSGGLTTLEAMWMGVPVVTWPGRRFCARHTASHVTVIGHPEWVAAEADDYVRIAAGLAADRAGLRSRMAASPLCDGAAFTRDLESLYRSLWHQHCAQFRIASSPALHRGARAAINCAAGAGGGFDGQRADLR
jgi:protein O-GlcNAc transferase